MSRQPQRPRARGLYRHWRLAVLAGAVAAITLVIDTTTLQLGARALARNPLPLGLALTAYTAAFVLRAAAWGPLLPVAVPWQARLRAILAMLAANHTLPGPVGELVRARAIADGAANRRCGRPGVENRDPSRLTVRRALLTVVAARVVDVFSLGLLLGLSALIAGEAPAWTRWGAPVAVLLPVAAAWQAQRWGVRLAPSRLARSAAWALPSWALEAAVVAAVAASAGFSLSPAGAVLATSASLLAQVAAVLPGGIGTYEAAMATALVALHLPAGDALAVAVMTHAVKFVYALATGLPALACCRRSLRPAPGEGLVLQPAGGP